MANRLNNKRQAARTRKMRARNYRLIFVFSFIIAMALAFMAGFWLHDQSSFLQSLGFPSSVTGIVDSGSDTSASKDVYNSVSERMAEVEDILDEDSLDEFDLDQTTIEALKAFRGGTDDPYLRYYMQDRYQTLLDDENGSYAGVGVLFSEYEDQAYAVDVFEGGSAALQGVTEGDFVVAINGDSSQSWSRSEVASFLSQQKGKNVMITWRRPSSLEAQGGEEFNTSLQCNEYNEENVSSDFDELRSVAYVKVKQFTRNAASLVQRQMSDLEDRGARAFVIDVRNNPGGYLSQAVELSSLFMESGNVAVIETIDGQAVKTATGHPTFKGPVVVLANKNTAAAAEVFVAALKENQRATIVGTTSMGKGSVQVLRELSFGGALRYTAAYYLTPEGHSIDRVGIIPDVAIDETEGSDAQRDYAHDLASSYLLR